MSYHFSIAYSATGGTSLPFKFNPLDIRELYPERPYTVLPTLEGPPLLQFPILDTTLRKMQFDIVPDENIEHRNFLMGTSETDPESLINLQHLDSNGQLTTYYLNIPESVKHWRPYGYRECSNIPIRIENVLLEPEPGAGMPRWRCTLSFRILPEE